MDRIGSVIVWSLNTTPEEAKKAIAALAKLGLIEQRPPNQWDPVGLPGVNDFNDEYGGPVWYIP
jgi:hypothetical protein